MNINVFLLFLFIYRIKKDVKYILAGVDTFQSILYILKGNRRRVEQLAARRAHNPEAVGSSPTPAKVVSGLSSEQKPPADVVSRPEQ